MEIEICNVIHNVCHTGGKSVSVTVLWAAQHGFKTRPGLVFKVLAELLMYCTSLTLLLYQSPHAEALMSPSIGCCVLSSMHGMQWHCWCRLSSLLPCVLGSMSPTVFLSIQCILSHTRRESGTPCPSILRGCWGLDMGQEVL